MKTFLKNSVARAIDSRKYDWIWDKIRDTHAGYFIRKILMSIMGISEDFAIRDVVSKSRNHILKMTHPQDWKERFGVLLIQLPLPSNRRHKRILPMGLASLAAYIRQMDKDINVGILDAQSQNMGFEEIMEKIKEGKWDVIGISFWSVQEKMAIALSKAIKSFKKDIKVVFGGIHSTALPEESIENSDFVILHEGEITFGELIDALKENKSYLNIPGLAYKINGRVTITAQRELIENLDSIPDPAYDLLPVERYKMPLHVVGGDRLPLMGSRGCPYKCSFCTSPILWQQKVRWRDAKRVVDEMERVIRTYEVSKFHFWDDNFTLNPNYVRDFCNEITSRGLDVEWVALDRAEHINRNAKLLPLMKKSGCVGIEIGLESANPDTFAHISKDQGIDESRKAIVNLRANNIIPLYTCMVFNPGESIVGYYMQKEFLDKAQEGYPWHRFFHPFPYPLYIGQFATPYKKTKFYENIENESLVLMEDMEDRFHHQINSIPYSLLNDIPVKTIEKLNEELYILFLNAVKVGFWVYFPGDDTKIVLSEKLYDIWRFIEPFFKSCDGTMSVHEIGKKLEKELGMPFIKAMRLTAYATYIFAQVGAIRSAIHYKDYEIKHKKVKVPLAITLDIISLLKPKGITRGNLVPKQK